ncbi:MAG: rhomboid family intramembrane serine protease [Planctomycetota bacterium]
MLLLPYSTDAPIYHWPITTISLIVVNTAFFVATTLQVVLGNVDVDAIEWLILDYGMINPLQWVTSVFMHGGIMHLLGNMFFLWSFGLVVEGKIGNVRFLAVYMAIAVIQSAIEQCMMFVVAGEGGSLGASSAVFGIMTIALLWAPENDIDCFYWVIYPGTFEISIVKLAGVFMFLQVVEIYLAGFAVSSGLLHLMGAFVGAPIGLWMLRQRTVDCERWDLISRNQWLQQYRWLCSAEQRRELQQNEEEHEDPVAAALSTTQSGATPSLASPAAIAGAHAAALPQGRRRSKSNHATATSDQRSVRSASKTPSKSAKPAWASKLSLSKQNAHRSADVPPSVGPPDIDHPDFNRLSMLLRQSIDSGSLTMAQSHFMKLDQLGIAAGISDKTLMSLVKLMAKQKQWTAALRPLHLIASHRDVLAPQAILQIAKVQWKVQRQPDLAIQTLRSFGEDDRTMDRPNSEWIGQRDRMLAEIQSS